MEAFLLIVHVLGGILFVGPVTIANSLFPRYVPLAAEYGKPDYSARTLPVAHALHRISRVYGLLGLLVPVAGIALALTQQRFGEIWITIAMVITAVAGGLMAFRIVPAQSAALAIPPDKRAASRLGALAGIFNVLWVAVLILMVVRPGSDYVS
ncbi:hypothetical protein [Cryobacterium sp. TMT4-31]|uniref:hypothetical protein n=1 Tax=Cryobacterium sp. TMT4-31 TaxID=1259259 RepID=UPI001068D817|nr:hypothetical protein [Cryobacterium sp. TMT4-31]TFC86374.1 hypothetical protein E3T19_15460 [Cryobacterium sp. TMT4-31]